MVVEAEPTLEKIQISGPTMASLLQRFSSSPGDIDGLLFGHVTHLTPSHFTDDLDPSTSSSTPTTSASPTTIATITSFLTTTNPNTSSGLIGYFSARRRSPLRPSLRESSTFTSSSSAGYIFLLMTSPVPDRSSDLIHTHEYRAYQFIRGSSSFVPKTLEVVNVGPAFRGQYGSFSPSSPFPALPVEFRGLTSMAEDQRDADGEEKERMGLDVGSLSRLVGPEAGDYASQVEDLYKGMLDRLDQLALLVDNTSSRVLDQENHNMKLRFKFAGLE